MRIFKAFIWTIAIWMTLFTTIGFFLPKTWTIERSTEIKAPVENVFKAINSPREWLQWTPWNNESDSTLIYSFDGPAAGKGAVQRWNSGSEYMNSGKMVIEASSNNESISYYLQPNDEKEYRMTGSISLTEARPGYTKVSWSESGPVVNPWFRYMALFMDKKAGPAYEKGLEKLKKYTEQSR